jgi:hypothetical protein
MRALFLLSLAVIVGCQPKPGEQAAPEPVGENLPKGDDKVASWPVRHPGFGSQLWEYCVPYQADVQKALDELRAREFKAGRFYKSEMRPKNYEEAIRNADAAGTRSIIDLDKISPTRDLEAISPVPKDKIRELFGTDKPSHAMVENASKKMTHEFQDFLETYDRGEGLYIILYDGDRPVEIYFAGWSFH